MIDWKKAVCAPSGPQSIKDPSDYVVRNPAKSLSPIDEFYASQTEILKVAVPDFFLTHPRLGPLLLVGVVSATENYFRDILARTILICPKSAAAAAEQSINLGSMLWHHGQPHVGRAAFDHLSFTSKKEIRKTTVKFTGQDIAQNSEVDAALTEFENVCQLRHNIAHSGAILAGRNAIPLGIPLSRVPLRIQLGYAHMQEVCAVCTSLVAAFNTWLFEVLVSRWANRWRKQKKKAGETAEFRGIWESFLSRRDLNNNTIQEVADMKTILRAAR